MPGAGRTVDACCSVRWRGDKTVSDDTHKAHRDLARTGELSDDRLANGLVRSRHHANETEQLPVWAVRREVLAGIHWTWMGHLEEGEDERDKKVMFITTARSSK